MSFDFLEMPQIYIDNKRMQFVYVHETGQGSEWIAKEERKGKKTSEMNG